MPPTGGAGSPSLGWAYLLPQGPLVKALVVDDEADLVQALAEFLERLGHDCLIAMGARQAIDSVDQNRPDLVLTDLRLPDGDGFDIIQHVRRILPQTSVILMTAYDEPGMEKAALRAGAAAYLRKPFALAALAKTIEDVSKTRFP